MFAAKGATCSGSCGSTTPLTGPTSTKNRRCSTPSMPPATPARPGAMPRYSCASTRSPRGFSEAALLPVSVSRLSEGGDHIRCDERDAALAAVKALRIRVGILADHQPFGDVHPAIDDDPVEPGVAADLDLGQHHRVARLRVRVDPAV